VGFVADTRWFSLAVPTEAASAAVAGVAGVAGAVPSTLRVRHDCVACGNL